MIRFVPPQEPKRLRFSLRALMLFVTIVGPTVLVVTALPQDLMVFGLCLVLAAALLPGLAWCMSFVRPAPLAIAFFSLVLISVVLFMSLFMGRDSFHMGICAAIGVSVWAATVTGLALVLSSSRYAP